MRLCGLYALTPEHSNDDTLLAQVDAAVAGGARILQYRCKHAGTAVRKRQAAMLAAYCRQHQICFIINDDAALARQCDADGVHLGQLDMPVAQARQYLGGDKLIGSTCHHSLARARAAAAAGADYIAMGAVFPSATKPQAARCPLTRLAAVKQQLSLPLVAIGGITPANAAQVIRAGADAVAVSQGLFGSSHITAAAAAISRLFCSDE